MGKTSEIVNLLVEIDEVQARIAKRLSKGEENYTEEDNLNSAKDDMLCKQLMEKVNKMKK